MILMGIILTPKHQYNPLAIRAAQLEEGLKDFHVQEFVSLSLSNELVAEGPSHRIKHSGAVSRPQFLGYL